MAATTVRLKHPLEAGAKVEAVLPTLQELEAAEKPEKEDE